jgi:ABC-type transport system involved in multi-copper enzyme maturation permease subunit
MSLRRIWAIARNTFREAVRDKVLYALLFFAILLILSALVLGQLSLHEEARVVRDMGLGGITLFSVIIATFVGSSLVYKEIDRKTVYTIVPKPLYRHEFVIGKFIGMNVVLGLQLLVMAAVLCGVLIGVGGSVEIGLIRAIVLLGVELVVVTAVALLFSSFSSPFLSAMFTLGVFAVGRSTPEIAQAAQKLGSGGTALRIIGRVVPDLHLFYVSGSIIDGTRVSVNEQYVSWGYVGSATLYGMMYAVVLVFVAALIFRRRDFV